MRTRHAILAVAALAALAACARQQEEVVYVDPAPIAAEPVSSKF